MRRGTLVPGSLALALAVACGADPPAVGTTAPPPARSAPGYEIVVDLRQTMLWILEPAAEVIWDSAGFVITAEGETDLSPTTETGWNRVRDSAALVAESGNLLQMPGRSLGPDWVGHAKAMTGAGKVVMAAATRRDAEALFDAGGQLYQTCRGCHDQYMQPAEPAAGAP